MVYGVCCAELRVTLLATMPSRTYSCTCTGIYMPWLQQRRRSASGPRPQGNGVLIILYIRYSYCTAYCTSTVYVPYVQVWYARPAPGPLWRVLTPVPRTTGQPTRPLSAAGPRAAAALALLLLVRASCQPIVVVCQSRFPARFFFLHLSSLVRICCFPSTLYLPLVSLLSSD